MSSVIVKGMEMPENCDSCDFCECFEGYYCGVAQENARILVDVRKERRPNCPLIPLPSEYGNLIDAEQLRSDIFDHFLDGRPISNDYDKGLYDAALLINTSECIVPAERSEK